MEVQRLYPLLLQQQPVHFFEAAHLDQLGSRRNEMLSDQVLKIRKPHRYNIDYQHSHIAKRTKFQGTPIAHAMP
jgi:hypothetical protein